MGKDQQKINLITYRILFFYCCSFATVTDTFARTSLPNYQLSLDTLQLFAPGNKQADLENKWGKGLLVARLGPTTIYRFSLKYEQYHFPIWVQIFQEQTLDFFAQLPSYFLHDLFYQAIINRQGKPDIHFLQENNAVYWWQQKNNVQHLYGASCTIICFPLYYAQQTTNPPAALSTYQATSEWMIAHEGTQPQQ